MSVAIQLIIQIYTSSFRRRLNLTLQISQGSATTYFRWSRHFRVSFVKGLFRHNPYNFYWNQFILDRQGTKYKLAQFIVRHGVYSVRNEMHWKLGLYRPERLNYIFRLGTVPISLFILLLGWHLQESLRRFKSDRLNCSSSTKHIRLTKSHFW